MNALELNQLCKSYDNFALQNVSFSVEKGTIAGLIGRNGAGKTTTIKCIVGAAQADSGDVRILRQSPDKPLMQEIGVVYDECCFNQLFHIEHLDRVFSSIFWDWSSDLFFGLCEKYGLPQKKKIKMFSRGMKQKLSIAAALAHDPKLLLLDEPTGGLDPVAREEILDDLQEYIEDGEHTVLLSTHITSDLDRVADQIILLSDGTVKLDEAKDTLLEDYCILRGEPAELKMIDPSDLLGVRRNAYSFEALAANKNRMNQKYPQVHCDHTNIEQIMVLMKGDADV